MNHHAYYIEGPLSHFEHYAEELKPFWAHSFERFGVDEARELIALCSLKSYKTAVFLIAASSMTSEAQQALLKLFEEPQEGTTFVLLLPHGVLIPTVRSRMLPFESPLLLSAEQSSEAITFLKSNGKMRSEMITKLLKEEEGVRERVREFVNALEVLLLKKIQDHSVREGLSDIAKVRSYLSDRSPSLKMLLEHLALCLPKS